MSSRTKLIGNAVLAALVLAAAPAHAQEAAGPAGQEGRPSAGRTEVVGRTEAAGHAEAVARAEANGHAEATARAEAARQAEAVGQSEAAARQPRRITLAEAIEIALRQSTDVARAENQVDLSRLAVSDAKMQFLPDLRISAGLSQNYGRTFDQDVGRLLTEGNKSLNGRISSSVTLFDGFANVARLRAAELDEAADALEAERARQTVVFSVISGFLSTVAAEEQVRVQEENLAAQLAQERQIRALVDAGTRPISDLYQQQANTAAARSAVVEAKRALELARLELVRTLRLDPRGSYEFVAPAIDDAAAAGDLPDLDALLEAAFERRPDLAALERRVRSAEQDVRVAGASRWPTVSLSASYGSGYSSARGLGFSDQLDQGRSGSIGLSISMPLFDRRSTSRQVERAEIQVENARLALEDLRQQIATEVRRAVLDREVAAQRLAAAEARVAAAERALEATRERYAAGVATVFEVSQSQAEAVAARSELLNARYTLVFQDELLGYYVGDLDPEKAAR